MLSNRVYFDFLFNESINSFKTMSNFSFRSISECWILIRHEIAKYSTLWGNYYHYYHYRIYVCVRLYVYYLPTDMWTKIWIETNCLSIHLVIIVIFIWIFYYAIFSIKMLGNLDHTWILLSSLTILMAKWQKTPAA